MNNDWFDIDGNNFDVDVISVKEKGSILYSDNTGRTMAVGAPMTLDPLGTFFNYEIVVRQKKNKEAEYDRLFTYISQPRYSGMKITAPHNQSTITFEAYISQAEREISKIDKNKGIIHWKELTLTITAMKAQVLPE